LKFRAEQHGDFSPVSIVIGDATMDLVLPFRRATTEDAPLLAELVNYAGEGMPLYLWSKLSSGGETAWDIGVRRALRTEGAFSYRNAVIVEDGGQRVGCLIGYGISDCPEPVASDLPQMFVPLQELENLAPGSWYVNVLAVLPPYRGQGLGTKLLGLADRIARSLGKRGTSVIVSDANTDARRLYKRCGYVRRASRPMIKEDWTHEGQNWVLLTKS
jgi:ribosomal protein S18 acetylase RimI-like enzyme